MKLRLFLLLTLISTFSYAQIARTSIVEHFTNTSCSVCASTNPTTHNTIQNSPNTLHISFHPSSPYASDVFSVQNKTENDDRTKFYGIFGSTPRIVVNGSPISTFNLGSVLTAAAQIKSNFKLSIGQNFVGKDSFQLRVFIQKVAADPTLTALLFVGAIEDTVTQTTNNGEPKHYNVFRKSLTQTAGDLIQLPIEIGDSLVLNFGFKGQSIWNLNRIQTIAILQEQNKQLINSTRSVNRPLTTTGISGPTLPLSALILYPNPSANGIFQVNLGFENLKVYNTLGVQLAKIGALGAGNLLNLSHLLPGTYIVQAESESKIIFQRIAITK